MNLFPKLLIILVFILGLGLSNHTAHASTQASNDSYSTQQFGHWKKKFQRWCSKKPAKCQKLKDRWNNRRGGGDSHAVPELNAAGAPLAILLIGGLLALGYESRKKGMMAVKAA